ncbi:hypothetical protein GH733_002687, partial [Mirounga leonina]
MLTGYYSLRQLSTFPSYQPTGGTHPIQYLPGRCPVLNQSAPTAWMPEPIPVPNCPSDTDDFTRNAYRTLRPFVLRVTDCMGREIMTMQRPFRCTYCCLCCPSTRQELEVQYPPGVSTGFVAEHWNLLRAVNSIQHEKKENVIGVPGPCSTYGCGSDSVS